VKINIGTARLGGGSNYPAPHDEPCKPREWRHLGEAAGLDQFGVNLLRLPPGAWSSQRHWHSAEDEFVWVVEGEVVLVTDAGEDVLRAGDCAGFKAGVPDGHHLQNRSERPAFILQIGSRRPRGDTCYYPEIDMRTDSEDRYVRMDGSKF